MDIEQWLGKENRLGIDIWKSKYQYNNETFDEWLDRVSGNDEEIKNLIIDKKFLFGGRILANRGLNRKLNKKLSMSNCFSGDTKFLTKNGVKRFDECVDTFVDVLTSKCKWERAEIMKFGKQQIGILELSKGKSRKTIKVTENHNWIIQNGSSRVIKKTNELRNGDIIPTVSENPIDKSHSGEWKVESYKLTDEYEDVYCANVPSTHDFVLENNILTHNCYVLSAPEDNIESIFETCGKLARTYSYGGGCGLDISKLRPANSKVNNAAKSTSGATSFMDLFSKITEVIGQSGRRGALMISISCEHPDAPEFIEIKKDLDKVTKANISIRFTDRFMNAVMNNQEVELTFKSESSAGEEIIRRKINARDLFMKMAESNWQMAEPGALFWDRISSWNLMSNNKDFEYAGTNPCA